MNIICNYFNYSTRGTSSEGCTKTDIYILNILNNKFATFNTNNLCYKKSKGKLCVKNDKNVLFNFTLSDIPYNKSYIVFDTSGKIRLDIMCKKQSNNKYLNPLDSRRLQKMIEETSCSINFSSKLKYIKYKKKYLNLKKNI